MKKILGVTLLVLCLTGCGEYTDTFAEGCKDNGGTVLKDTTSTTGISTKDGSVVFSTTTVRLCVVDGDVVDMDVY